MRRYFQFKLVGLLALVLLSLCVQRSEVSKPAGLILTIDAPSSVRVGEEFEVYVDLENNADKAYRIKKLELFDVGSFKLIKCEPELQNRFPILPHGAKTLTCRLRAEQAIRDRVEVQIAARVIYENNVSFVQDFDVVSFEEYQKRVKAKQWKELPKSFTKQSEEIKATIELSENPMIKRNLTETLSVKFSDIGNGLLTKINCTLSSLPLNLLYCLNCQKVKERWACAAHVKDKESEPLTCLVNLSAINQSYLKVFTKIQLSYDYEIRKTARIKVVR